MAVKIANPTYGVAKNANIVAIKLAFDLIDSGGELVPQMSLISFIDAIALAAKDIDEHDLQGKTVINISLGCE
jgi:hypothetical protein